MLKILYVPSFWMPIGKYYNYGNGNGNNRLFFGKFDGNGHVIKNMHIQWEGTDAWSAWGLFSTLQGSSSTNLTTVTNLIIENAVVVVFTNRHPDTATQVDIGSKLKVFAKESL